MAKAGYVVSAAAAFIAGAFVTVVPATARAQDSFNTGCETLVTQKTGNEQFTLGGKLPVDRDLHIDRIAVIPGTLPVKCDYGIFDGNAGVTVRYEGVITAATRSQLVPILQSPSMPNDITHLTVSTVWGLRDGTPVGGEALWHELTITSAAPPITVEYLRDPDGDGGYYHIKHVSPKNTAATLASGLLITDDKVIDLTGKTIGASECTTKTSTGPNGNQVQDSYVCVAEEPFPTNIATVTALDQATTAKLGEYVAILGSRGQQDPSKGLVGGDFNEGKLTAYRENVRRKFLAIVNHKAVP